MAQTHFVRLLREVELEIEGVLCVGLRTIIVLPLVEARQVFLEGNMAVDGTRGGAPILHELTRAR